MPSRFGGIEVKKSRFGGTPVKEIGGMAQLSAGVGEKVADAVRPFARIAETAFTAPADLLTGVDVFDLYEPGAEPALAEALSASAKAYPPVGGDERIMRRTGQEVGNALNIIGAGTAGALQTSTRPVMEMAKGPVRQVVREGANLIRNNPASVAIAEALFATGSGLGAGIAQEVDPGDKGTEMMMQMAGGLGPSLAANSAIGTAFRVGLKGLGGLASLATPGGRRAASEAVERMATRKAREVASQSLGDELQGPAMENLREAQRLREEIGPNYQPTLAQAAESVPLARQQERLNQRMSGAELNQQVARERASEQAVQDFADKVGPKSDFNAEFVIDSANKSVANLSGRLENELGRNTRQRAALADNLYAINKSSTGESIRQSVADARKAKSTQMSKLADDLGISKSQTALPIQALKQRIASNEAINPKSVLADKRNVPAAVRDLQNVDVENLTFQDLKAFRERIGEDLMDAMASPKGRTKAVRALTALKKEVDTFMDDVFLGQGVDPQLAQNYKQFRDTYRQEFADVFEKGAAFKVRQTDGTGFHRIPDEQVASAFFSPGDTTSAKQFKQIFGDTQNPAMEAVALDSLRDAAVRDGVLDQKAVQTWMRRHADVLNEFPSVKRRVENIAFINNSLIQRQQQLVARQKRIADTQLGKTLVRYGKGNKSPEQVLQDAIKNPILMRELKGSVRRQGPEQLEALRRNVWQEVSGGSPEQIERYIKNNQRSLRFLFGQKHLDNLKTIQTARRKLGFTRPTTGSAVESDVAKNIKRSIGADIGGIASSHRNLVRGRSEYIHESTNLLARFLSARKSINMDEAFKQALNDPQVAEDMVTLYQMSDRSSLGQKAAKALQKRLFRVGIGMAIRSPLVIETAVEE